MAKRKTTTKAQVIAALKKWATVPEIVKQCYQAMVYGGAYWGIGTEIEGYANRGPGYGGTVLDGLVLNRLRAVRTDFDAFTEGEQLALMNHGWALADAALRTYMRDALPDSLPPGVRPSAELLEHPERAAEVLKDSDKLRPFGR